MLVAAALLSACAAPPKKPFLEGWPEYKVTGRIGLVVGPSVTPINVRAVDSEAAARLDSLAEKKRKEASMGVGVTALTILLAPLAILTPLYPPASQAALLPFAAADATAKASQDADHLRQEAAKARQEAAACGEWLAARHPELAEKFQRTLSDGSLQPTIQDDLRFALEGYLNLPVVSLARPEDASFAPFLSEASRRQLQSVLEIDIHSVDLSVESRDLNAGDCAFKITGHIKVQWWDVEHTLIVYRVGALPGEGEEFVLYKSESLPNKGTISADEIDLLTLVDHPEQFRAQVAEWVRNGILKALNRSTLKFP